MTGRQRRKPALTGYLLQRVLERLHSCWKGAPRRRLHRQLWQVPLLEPLEDRLALSTFFVTNTNDSGAGSLRQAILNSNAAGGTNTIDFAIGTGTQTIKPTSALPALTSPVILDGTTESGYSGTPLIVIDGSLAGANVNGLYLTGGSSTVRGLVIDNFGGNGIQLDDNGNDLIVGNYIGTDATGTLARPNGGVGVEVTGGSNDTIGGTTPGAGNLISGNTQGGVRINTGTILVFENYVVLRIDPLTGAVVDTIATPAASGAAVYGADGSLYLDDYYGNQILHYDANGNLLSSFGTGHLNGPQAMIFGPDGNLYVGDTASTVQEFSANGAFIQTFVAAGSGGLSNTKGLAFGADGNLYVASLNTNSVLCYNGSTGAFIKAFIISGSGGLSYPEGITFGPDGNLYVSSYGTNSVLCYNGSTGAFIKAFVTSGSGGLANAYGLCFDSQGNLEVSSDSQGKVYLYNGQTGAYLSTLATGLSTPNYLTTVSTSLSQGNVIEGNRIGTNASGSAGLPNGFGILVETNNNTIGGTAPAASNTIADNSGKGVIIGAGNGNAIEGNAIFGNTGLGIDLANDGVTANTGSENSSLPNSGMNFPVLTSATESGSVLTVGGYIGTAAGQTVFAGSRVEIFKSDNNSSGHGGGLVYLGYLTADATGSFSGSLTVSGLNVGDTITATATDTISNTSEFAANTSVTGTGLLGTSTSLTVSPGSLAYGQSVTLTATVAALNLLNGIPTGLVTFMDGASYLGTVTLGLLGTAVLTTTSLPVGSDTITALYGGSLLFAASTASQTVTVTPATLTVSVNNASRTYGSVNPTFTDTITGFVNGDTGNVVSGSASLSTTATVSSGVGSYAITASLGTLSAANYTFTFASGTLTVTPATLLVTADSTSKVYGTANPTFTDTITGFVNGDTTSTVSGSASLTTTATASSGVGTYTITAALGTLSASNYTFTFANGTLTVTPATLQVTASDASKVYGQVNPALSDTVTGFVNGDTSSVVSGSASLSTTATTSSGVGTYTITAALGTLSAANYSFSFVNGTLTVTPAALLVTADTTSKVYGQANPTFTDTITGFVNGDTTSTVSGSASLTTTATTSSGVGTYTLTAALGTLSAANYTFTFANGTLTITPASLLVTASDASKVYGQVNPALTDTVTGFVNGDTSSVVSGSASLSTTATLSSGVGTYTITAAVGTLSASNYAFTFTTGTLTVTPAQLTVTANDASRVYGQSNPTFTDTLTGFVNGDSSSVVSGSASLTTPATASSGVGTYTISAALGSLSATNYSFSFVNGMLSVTPASLRVTADSTSKVYGTANPTFTDTITGFVNGDTTSTVSGSASLTTTATTSSGVGTYTISAALGTLSAANYSFTFVNGTLSITPAILLVTADSTSKVYGSANPTFTDTITGFVNGDTSSVVSGSANLSTTATASSGVGTYTITAGLGSLSAANYTFTVADGTLTVTPAPLVVTANDATRTYGQTNPPFSASYNGFVNGDTTASLGGALTFQTPATTSSAAGSYAITPTGLTSTNYAITYVPGTLFILPATASGSSTISTSSSTGSTPANTPTNTTIGDPTQPINTLPGSAVLPAGDTPGASLSAESIAATEWVPSSSRSSSTAGFGSGVSTAIGAVEAGNSTSTYLLAVSSSSALSASAGGWADGDPVPAAGLALGSVTGRLTDPVISTDVKQPTDPATDNRVKGTPPPNPVVTAPPPGAARPDSPTAQAPSIPAPSPQAPAGPEVAAAQTGAASGLENITIDVREDTDSLATVVTSILVLTTGFVILNSRVSLLLLGALAARPLVWRGFDPVEVLVAWEEEKRKGRSSAQPSLESETLQSLVR